MYIPDPKYNGHEVIKKLKKGKNLIDIPLYGIDLSGANLSEIKNGGFCPKRANLSGSDLSYASLKNTNLNNAFLSRAIFIEACLWETNLRGADLEETDFWLADLRGANLNNANLKSAKLTDANLKGANLHGANLNKADLYGANLNEADLHEADLQDAKLNNVDLKNADLRGANLISADFENACLKEANISGACIFHIKTHGWNIEGIKCTHVYQYPDWRSWKDPKVREKSIKIFNDQNKFEDYIEFLPLSLNKVFIRSIDTDSKHQTIIKKVFEFFIETVKREYPDLIPKSYIETIEKGGFKIRMVVVLEKAEVTKSVENDYHRLGLVFNRDILPQAYSSNEVTNQRLLKLIEDLSGNVQEIKQILTVPSIPHITKGKEKKKLEYEREIIIKKNIIFTHDIWTREERKGEATEDDIQKWEKEKPLFVDMNIKKVYNYGKHLKKIENSPKCYDFLVCLLKNRGSAGVEEVFEKVYPEKKRIKAYKNRVKILTNPACRLRGFLKKKELILHDLKNEIYSLDESIAFILAKRKD